MTTIRTDEVDGYLAKNVVKWMVTVGIAGAFLAGGWAMNQNNRLDALEKHSVTREEAAKLQGSMDLLRFEITELRNELRKERP